MFQSQDFLPYYVMQEQGFDKKNGLREKRLGLDMNMLWRLSSLMAPPHRHISGLEMLREQTRIE